MPASDRSATARSWWKRGAVVVGVVWLGFFAYLLLAADPPDFWFEDIGTVDGPGHVVGGAVTGAGVYLLLARRRRAVPMALGAAIALLVVLELIQDRFTDRGYEASDVVLSAIGVALGVAAAGVGYRMMRRSD